MSTAAKALSIEGIRLTVCRYFHLHTSELASKDRHKSIAHARHVAMYLCRQRLKHSFPELGRAFGRDHSTVISGVRKIGRQREDDPHVRAQLEVIEREIDQGAGP